METTLASYRTDLEIQLNRREITQSKQLNKSEREATKLCTHRRISFSTACPHLHNKIQNLVDGVTFSKPAGGKDTSRKDHITIKTQKHTESQHK